MSSLWILLLFVGAALASSDGPSDGYKYPIKGREIKHMMSLPTLPDECKKPNPQKILFAYVPMYRGVFKGKMYCDKAIKFPLRVRVGNEVIKTIFLLRDNLLYKKVIGRAGTHKSQEPVPDDEVFQFVGTVYYEDTNEIVSDDRMQQVVFNDLLPQLTTKVLEDIHTLCLRICDAGTRHDAPLYFETDRQSVGMSVDCDSKTVRLVDEDGATVNAFTPSESMGIPVIYDWMKKDYQSDVSTLPTDTWVQIRHSGHYTESKQDPLYVEYSNELFPLSQLKEDFGALWKRLLNSGNIEGVVILNEMGGGAKVIANLRKPSHTNPGQETGALMEVEAIFDRGDQQIFFHDADFCDKNGVKLEAPPLHIEKVRPVSGHNPIVEEYVDVNIFREVFRSQTQNIKNSFDQYKKNVPVKFVYKGRSFWTAEFKNNGTSIYLIENLEVLTVHTVGDKKVAKKTVHDLLYFLPLYEEGAFISHDIPLRNVLAIRLTPYEPPPIQQQELLNNVEELIRESCRRTNSKPVLYFESSWQLVRMSVDCVERKVHVADEDSEMFNIFPTSESAHPSKTYVFDNDQTPLTLVEDSPDYTWVLRKPYNYEESERTPDIENKVRIPLYELKDDLTDLYAQMSPLFNLRKTGAVILNDKMIVSLTKRPSWDHSMQVGGEIHPKGDKKVSFNNNKFVEEIDVSSTEHYAKLAPLPTGNFAVEEYIYAETFRGIIRSQSDTIRNKVKGKDYPNVIVDFAHKGRASLTAIYTNEGIEKYSIKNMRVLITNTNDEKISVTKREHPVVYFLPNKEGGAFVTEDHSLRDVFAVRLSGYDKENGKRYDDPNVWKIIHTIDMTDKFSDWKVILRAKINVLKKHH